MFTHIYSDRKDFSIIDVMYYAEAILGYKYDGFTVIHVRLSDFIKYPAAMWDVYSWIECGRKENLVVLLQNDVSQQSIKTTLKGRVPVVFEPFINRLDQLVKANTVAI